MQFEKHGSSFEKTKLKLLEAANLVDKVTSDVKRENHKHTLKVVMPIFSSDKSNFVSVTLPVHRHSTTRI